MLAKFRATWNQLKRERQIRWATESHHCVACGVRFGPNNECACV